MLLSLILILGVLNFACAGGGADTSAVTREKEMETLREQMVERQIQARGIKDAAVLKAMKQVHRHQFVLPGSESEAYEDTPLPIGEGQTISQPYIVALMTELSKVNHESKVLEIGTGSGYQAAVLSVIAKEVFSIEIVESLGNRARDKLKALGYSNVAVRVGDGYKGWPEEAPFDAVLVTAAPDHVPQPLVDQLKVGGRLVIPVGDFYQELKVITKTAQGTTTENVIAVRFVPMTGEAEKQ